MPPKSAGRAKAQKPTVKKPPASSVRSTSSGGSTQPAAGASNPPVPKSLDPPAADPQPSDPPDSPLPKPPPSVKAPSQACINNITTTLDSLRIAVISKRKERREEESSATSVKKGERTAEKGSKSGKGGKEAASGDSDEDDEAGNAFKEGSALQKKVFKIGVMKLEDVEAWHQWVVIELCETMLDDLKPSRLLDHLWAIIDFVRQAGRFHTKSYVAPATLEDVNKIKPESYTTAEERQALRMLAIVMDAVCEVLLSVDLSSEDEATASRTCSQDWVLAFVELLLMSRGGVLFGLDFSTKIAEHLWLSALENTEGGQNVKDILVDKDRVGWERLGLLFLEARATNTFLCLARLIVTCLPKQNSDKKPALDGAFRTYGKIWGPGPQPPDNTQRQLVLSAKSPGAPPTRPALISEILRQLALMQNAGSGTPLEYMNLLNTVADWDALKIRTRGFILLYANSDGKDLCAGKRFQARLKKGEVVMYVDHERLLIKGYGDEGWESDVLLGYDHMQNLREVDGDGSGVFEYDRASDSADQSLGVVRFAIKAEDSGNFLAEVNKRLAQRKAARPSGLTRSKSFAYSRSARSATRRPPYALAQDSGPASGVKPGDERGALAVPRVLVPESDSAGQNSSRPGPSGTVDSNEAKGASDTPLEVIADSHPEPKDTRSSLRNAAAKGAHKPSSRSAGPVDLSATVTGSSSRLTRASSSRAEPQPTRMHAPSGRIVGSRNAKTGAFTPVSMMRQPRDEDVAEEDEDGSPEAEVEEQAAQPTKTSETTTSTSTKVSTKKAGKSEESGNAAPRADQGGSGNGGLHRSTRTAALTAKKAIKSSAESSKAAAERMRLEEEEGDAEEEQQGDASEDAEKNAEAENDADLAEEEAKDHEDEAQEKEEEDQQVRSGQSNKPATRKSRKQGEGDAELDDGDGGPGNKADEGDEEEETEEIDAEPAEKKQISRRAQAQFVPPSKASQRNVAKSSVKKGEVPTSKAAQAASSEMPQSPEDDEAQVERSDEDLGAGKATPPPAKAQAQDSTSNRGIHLPTPSNAELLGSTSKTSRPTKTYGGKSKTRSPVKELDDDDSDDDAPILNRSTKSKTSAKVLLAAAGPSSKAKAQAKGFVAPKAKPLAESLTKGKEALAGGGKGDAAKAKTTPLVARSDATEAQDPGQGRSTRGRPAVDQARPEATAVGLEKIAAKPKAKAPRETEDAEVTPQAIPKKKSGKAQGAAVEAEEEEEGAAEDMPWTGASSKRTSRQSAAAKKGEVVEATHNEDAEEVEAEVEEDTRDGLEGQVQAEAHAQDDDPFAMDVEGFEDTSISQGVAKAPKGLSKSLPTDAKLPTRSAVPRRTRDNKGVQTGPSLQVRLDEQVDNEPEQVEKPVTVNAKPKPAITRSTVDHELASTTLPKAKAKVPAIQSTPQSKQSIQSAAVSAPPPTPFDKTCTLERLDEVNKKLVPALKDVWGDGDGFVEDEILVESGGDGVGDDQEEGLVVVEEKQAEEAEVPMPVEKAAKTGARDVGGKAKAKASVSAGASATRTKVETPAGTHKIASEVPKAAKIAQGEDVDSAGAEESGDEIRAEMGDIDGVDADGAVEEDEEDASEQEEVVVAQPKFAASSTKVSRSSRKKEEVKAMPAAAKRKKSEVPKDETSSEEESGEAEIEVQPKGTKKEKSNKRVRLSDEGVGNRSVQHEPHHDPKPRTRKRQSDAREEQTFSVEPASKKTKVDKPKVLADPHETAILQITDKIHQEMRDHLVRRARAPRLASRSAHAKLVKEAAEVVDGFVKDSMNIKSKVDSALKASLDKYQDLKDATARSDEQLKGFVEKGKKAIEAGKKGFGGKLPKVMFAVAK